uniref:hypothetical protein n=1 Tax=Altererythrobacter segetis TaxID=1104773 RepID=UPI00311AABCF
MEHAIVREKGIKKGIKKWLRQWKMEPIECDNLGWCDLAEGASGVDWVPAFAGMTKGGGGSFNVRFRPVAVIPVIDCTTRG